MNLGGFSGNILKIDLSEQIVERIPMDPSLAKDYIGGLGLTLKLAYDNIQPGINALDPGNTIVLGAGPFVGTDLPSTSRVFSVTKLPSSGTIGWCGAGGFHFGCEMKNTGYDHIIISGKSEHPVYIRIIDNDVQICDARNLWGMGVAETCEALWKDHERPVGVLSIGKAGENKVAFSMAFIDRISTLGRGGFGAVMGSKNLKAIMVKGNLGVEVADRKRFRVLRKPFLENIRQYPYLKEWQHLGMLKSFPAVPVETYEGIKKRRLACVSCPIGCKEIVEIPDGPFKGMMVHTSSAMNLFTGLNYGFKDYRESIKLIATLDEYGLDMFEFFGLMGFAKVLHEKGLISKTDLDSEMRIDSLASMETWAEKIVARKGLGDVLANGFAGMLAAFGEDSKKFAPPLIKGIHPYTGPGSALPWDLFGTMELGQALDPRGPHVGSGGSPTYFAKRPLEVFPKHFERMGIPASATDRIISSSDDSSVEKALHIGILLKYSHSWFSILGSMGICARGQINRFYNAELCAQLYEAVTGITTDVDDLRQRVDRIWTLYKMANLRDGFNKDTHEILPEQWFGENGFKDYVSGKPLNMDQAQKMIEDYYEEWGWDRKSGIPTRETLDRLNLSGI
jgi:aldehyde:ferredoxin oxidoreductase